MKLTASMIVTAALSGIAALGTATAGPGCSSGQVASQDHYSSGSQGAEVSMVAYGAEKDIVDTAVAAGNFSILATALTEAGLISALKSEGPFTVFAPTDAAFGKLPAGTLETLLKPENREMLRGILKYHVVSGEYNAKEVLGRDTLTTLNGQRIDVDASDTEIDGAGIAKTDIMASNGIIHVIDEVILPESKSIVDIATGNDSFTTLTAALQAAGLVDALKGDGPFTVFAPTDEAFAALPEGTLESLLKPENRSKLRSILLYHVVEGRIYSDQAIEAGQAETLQGDEVMIKKSWGNVKVNDAKVVTADLEASNGVIHVIDAVILPKD